MYERAGPAPNLTPSMSPVSPERKWIKKKTQDREAKTKSGTTNIHISLEGRREKAGYVRIRRKRKCRATRNLQDKSKIFQHEKILNERLIQATRE
jgi:hypothetical protein